MGSLRFRGDRESYHAWGGLVVLALGVILLLDRLGVVYARDIFRFWPILLVAAGTVILVEAASLTLRTVGGTVLAMGLILQANNLGYLHIRGDVFWPLALIGVGVVMLGRALENRTEPPVQRRASDPSSADFSTRFWSGAERFVRNLESASGEHAAVFSHIQRRVTDQNLEKMKVVAVFGGFQLDLRPAGIQGDHAVIHADAVFGGVEIVVPEDWEVVPQGAGVFGGFADQTRPPDAPSKRLIVTGAGVFGGVVITNNPGHWNRHRMRMRERRWQYRD
jgi:predicted membrane protein